MDLKQIDKVTKKEKLAKFFLLRFSTLLFIPPAPSMYTQHTHKNTFALFLTFLIKPDPPEQWKEAYLTNLIL